ncbi:MAG: hypothetical protein PHV85_00015 [Desulfovibrionaceae bacterium]|nr:hypothetical protein [Desulfovibrionaceae bacterium]
MNELKNARRVHEFLREQGYKASYQTVLNHHRDGKLKARADGSFTPAAVRKYAKDFLPLAATGLTAADDRRDALAEKLELEKRKLQAEIEEREYKLEKARAGYIPRGLFQQELAARAAVLDSGLRHMVLSKAGDWVFLVGGEARKVNELVRRMQDEVDRLLTDYAGTDRFHVLDAMDPEAE